jgi:hypothetical protein
MVRSYLRRAFKAKTLQAHVYRPRRRCEEPTAQINPHRRLKVSQFRSMKHSDGAFCHLTHPMMPKLSGRGRSNHRRRNSYARMPDNGGGSNRNQNDEGLSHSTSSKPSSFSRLQPRSSVAHLICMAPRLNSSVETLGNLLHLIRHSLGNPADATTYLDIADKVLVEIASKRPLAPAGSVPPVSGNPSRRPARR